MVSSTFLRVFDILRELNRRRTIPASYQETLEERLTTTFKPSLSRLKRSKTPRSKEEYRLQYKERKAQKVYVEILEDYPHIFVPFLLAVSPKTCEKFDLAEFRQKHDVTSKLDLRDDAQAILESIAKKGGFNLCRLYQLLIASLFPQVSQRPFTSAETDNCWVCRAADLDAARNIFGERIFSAIEGSTRWMQEGQYRALHVTECIGMKLPKQNYQDAIISLEVCLAEEVVKTLFPSTYERILSLASASSPEDVPQEHGQAVEPPERQKTGSSDPHRKSITSDLLLGSEDSLSHVFQAARTSVITSIFGSRIANAIEKSQLREWEKGNCFLETTDCISLKVYRQQPYNATFHLRIGFVAGTYIASTLYA